MMENCRLKFYQEIDIVEHIMQFREVRALLKERIQAVSGGNEFEGKSDGEDRKSYFERARTVVFKEHDLLKS